MQRGITAHTKLFGLIGHPIGHSLSPGIHNRAFRHFGMDALYLLFHFPSFERAMEWIRQMNVGGFNVTAPYKQRIAEELAAMDETAAKTGAVNTVINRGGKFYGANTDVTGFLKSWKKAGAPSPEKETFLIIGSGASAFSVGYALCMEGAARIFIAARNREKARLLAKRLDSLFPGTENSVCSLENTGETETRVALCAGIINCTPLWRHTPVSLEKARKNCLIYDLLYAPARTAFLQEAAARNLRHTNGLAMLLYQAEGAFRLWTGEVLPRPLIENFIEKYGRT